MDDFPLGEELFELVEAGEGGCEKVTHQQGHGFGNREPITRNLLGTLLSLLYREACCFQGCQGGDHFPQRVAARITGNALGAYRLIHRGYYDESLSLTRSIGEIANMFILFAHDKSHYVTWMAASENDRWNKYRPAEVRKKLKAANVPIPIDETRYRILCSVGVHLGPEVSPQAHASGRVPTLGSYFHHESYLASLNELAAAVGVAAAGLQVFLPAERKGQIKAASVELLRNIGSVDLAKARSVDLKHSSDIIGSTDSETPSN